MGTLHKELINKLYTPEQNPFLNFDHTQHPEDMQGCGSWHPNFETMLRKHRPRLALEIGSWKGASAINQANIARSLGLNYTLLSIDTWLGSLEHRALDGHCCYDSLRMKNGYPQLYYTFLSNVVRTGHQNTIVPFPSPSQIAARWLKTNNIKYDLAYIDGSHDFFDAYSDMTDFYDNLTVGGALFGDDYSWKSVEEALHLFSEINDIEVKVTPDKMQWMITKKDERKPRSMVDILRSAKNNNLK